ncbi:Taurine--pyruvate aminotransferase [subsurface metagenome]
MEKRLWENAAKVGAHLNKRLKDIARKSRIVGTIHGVGLMQGVEIVEDKQSKANAPSLTDAIRQRCEEKGLIMIIDASSLCIYPSLIITEEESDKICDILGETIEEIEAERK